MLFTLSVLLAVFIVVAGWWLSRADADLALLLVERFGKRPGSLQGHVVWITGASGGIGEWLSYKLAEAGAKLVLSGTNEEKLNDVQEKCLGLGMNNQTKVMVLPFDLTNISCHADKVKAVVEHFGTVDVLVNNAGRCIFGDFDFYKIEEDKALFDVNVFGPVSLTRHVLAHARQAKKRAHIVATTSISGLQGNRVAPVYSATKHAVQGYFESLMVQGKVTGMTDVTILCPGPVLTPLVQRAHDPRDDAPAIEKTPGLLLPQRCAELMCVAIANKLGTVWICENPLLSLFYLNQYLPGIFERYVIARIPWNMTAMNEMEE